MADTGVSTQNVRNAIAENATGPRSAATDGVNVTQHPIADQIEAAQYLAGREAATKPYRGLRFTKLVPAGPT